MRGLNNETLSKNQFYMDSDSEVYHVFKRNNRLIAEHIFGGDYLLDFQRKGLTPDQRKEGFEGYLDPSKLRYMDSREFGFYLDFLKSNHRDCGLVGCFQSESHKEVSHQEVDNCKKNENVRILYTPKSYVEAGRQIMAQENHSQSQPKYSDHPVVRAAPALNGFVEAVKSIDAKVREIVPSKKSSEFLTMSGGPRSTLPKNSVPDGGSHSSEFSQQPLDFQKARESQEGAERGKAYEEIAHLADHIF